MRSRRRLGVALIVVAVALVAFATMFADQLGPVRIVVLVIALLNGVRGSIWLLQRR